MLDWIVYIIIASAVVAAIIYFVRIFSHKQKPDRTSCSDCPLASKCNEKTCNHDSQACNHSH